ncbi:prephenate dehydrogenase/arogenate dehydrogenase family protein [Methanofollis formosanus]|uniref:Prephenate dehydrogenase/arogenate dehydrogenase family protein n=1 Tax=Methanofollis formosanus TaxID=299308 RepID=A0A8G1EH25_9EURY|nr:prephenate dehydrogenase/arogenate dehydrogenase family protein [Methanofollis formosanus]QYZ79532.1 prephenate dehydrogenase/arogenate dehydrogenase family protein [Methanofollis formosanus]
MRLGIIGGTGGMGTFFARVFEEAGWEVLVSGPATALTNIDLARTSDVVMVSVPIRKTVAVIEEVGPVLRDDRVLCDLTSLKAAPVAAMLRTEAAVLGLHPMFGPTTPTLAGQTVVACPARIDADQANLLLDVIRAGGARVIEMDPAAHDRMMAVVQGLTHYTTLTLAGTMRRLGVDLDALLAVTSPVYRTEMALVGRLLGQDPALYAAILQENPAVPAVLDAFREAATEAERAVRDGEKEFVDLFARDAAFFSAYIEEATEESEALVQCLATR